MGPRWKRAALDLGDLVVTILVTILAGIGLAAAMVLLIFAILTARAAEVFYGD